MAHPKNYRVTMIATPAPNSALLWLLILQKRVGNKSAHLLKPDNLKKLTKSGASLKAYKIIVSKGP